MNRNTKKPKLSAPKKIVIVIIFLITAFLIISLTQSNPKKCNNTECFKNAIISCTPGTTFQPYELTIFGIYMPSNWKSTIIQKTNNLCKVEILNLANNSKEDCYYRPGGTIFVAREQPLDTNDPNLISVVYCDNNN